MKYRRFQNTHVTRCIVRKTYGRLLQRRRRSRIVSCMDRSHKIHFVEREAIWRMCMVRKETDEETNDLKTRQCMARYVEAYVWCIKTQSEAKPKLDNARQLRDIFFIETEDEDFNNIMKNARRKLEIPNKFLPLPQALQIDTRCEGRSGKDWENEEKYQHGAQFSKSQRQTCTPRWLCERWFRIIRSIHWARIISITNDSSKSHGYHLQTAGLRRTSSRRSISLHPGQNGRRTNVIENSKVRMSRYLDTSTETQMAKIMVQYGRSGCSSWTESVRSPFGRTMMGKSIRESSIKTRLGKRSDLGMLVC